MSDPMVRAPSRWLIGVLGTANLAVGFSAGYRTLSVYLAFWFLAALAVLSARRVVRHVWPADTTNGAIRTAVVAFALVVGCGLLLGAAGLLTVSAFATAESILFAASYVWFRDAPEAPSDRDRSDIGVSVPAGVVGVVGALAAFAIVFGATHAPTTQYDSLSYHLFFAARWVQDRAISIIPTPFSDVAQAYTPANGELFFAWLMLPFHGDLLARVGQLPFAWLAAATLVAVAARLGVPRDGAIYPAIFLLMARPVMEQALGANVDLICATLFLVSVHFALIAIESDERRDWMLLGVAAGLYLGTKYLAVAYLPVLFFVAFSRGLRLKALWALPGLAAFGLPWYLRNWIVAGSPLYPAGLTVAGVTIARGAFDRAAMFNTVFHVATPRLLPFVVARAMGPTLFLLWLPCAAIGASAMLRRGRWPHVVLLAVPLMILALCWFVVPVNTELRFPMPAVPFALLPLGFVFSRTRAAWNRAAHAVLLVGLAWIVIGDRVEIPAHLPWFMQGTLALDGLVRTPYLTMFALIAAAIAIAWRLRPQGARWRAPVAASLVVAASAVVAADSVRACPDASCEFLSATSPFIRPVLFDGWNWVNDNVTDSTIAYTGINLPYPLTGRRLTNRVVYANIDGRLRWRFHDYDHAFRSGRFVPRPPLLATSSGELLPAVPNAAGTVDALRPRYERMQGIREAWEDNLTRLHARWLFISSLSAYEKDYVWHDELEFPIEEAWAEEDSAMFQLRFENTGVRIYAIVDPRSET